MRVPKQIQPRFTNSLDISADELLQLSRALAKGISQDHPNGFKAIVAVTRGGMSVAMYIATELNIRLVETAGISNYDTDDRRLQKPEIFKPPMLALQGEDSRNVLVIDEVSDSGDSLRALQEIMPHATFAVIHIKPAGQDCVDYYVNAVPQDTWINYPRDTTLKRIKT